MCVRMCLWALAFRACAAVSKYTCVRVGGCERERESDKEKRERSYLYAILRLSAFGRVGRQKRLGGMKSWEVQREVNEAEQMLL